MNPDTPPPTDGDLAARSRAGSHAAFAEIMRRYREAVYRLARAQIGDADEALDVVQDSFAAAWRNIGRYDSERPMRAWLAAIALNRCRDWHRRRKVRALFRFGTPEAIEAVADPAPGPEASAGQRAELARLRAAIAALPTALREVLVLRTIEGLSQAETAGALGISAKAVETRLYRARGKLAESFGAA